MTNILEGSYNVEVAARELLTSAYAGGIRNWNLLGERQGYTSVKPWDESFRLELALTALPDFQKATGYRLNPEQYTSPDDMAWLLAQTVPYHLARAYALLSRNVQIGFSRTVANSIGAIQIEINALLAVERLFDLFGPKIHLAGYSIYSISTKNPLYKLAITKRPLSTWSVERN